MPTRNFRILTDILKRYDRNMVPSMKGVDVDVELLIQKISEINEIQSSSKMDILFSQIWHDPGLKFQVTLIHMFTDESVQDEEGAQCLTNLSLSHRMVESIWIPNVCLVNSKASSIHSSPTPNVSNHSASSLFIRVLDISRHLPERNSVDELPHCRRIAV